MSTQIPLYRAKRVFEDEYVQGLLTEIYDDGTCIINGCYECYTETLSIHFSDMLDSQGNKIFASLSENGKGGDMTLHYTFVFRDGRIKARYIMRKTKEENLIDIGKPETEKIIGIQQ